MYDGLEADHFIDANYSWLKLWLSRTRIFPHPEITCQLEGAPLKNQMQIFKNTVRYLPLRDKLFRDHSKNILKAAVFGHWELRIVGGLPHRTMKGFYELFHRLPTAGDVMGIYILSTERWYEIRKVNPFDISQGFYIVSECCIDPVCAVRNEYSFVHAIENLENCPIVMNLKKIHTERDNKILNLNVANRVPPSDDMQNYVSCPYCKQGK